MHKITPLMAVILLLTLANLTANAQDKEKTEKPKTTTVDAWRNALPVSEQPPTSASTDESSVPEVAETPAEIEKKVLALEKNLMEALKTRDSAALKNLLADDFLLAGINIAGTKSDKIRYIDWAVKNLELKTYILDKTVVRAFPTTAIVTYSYKRQANIGATPSDGEFTVTDVWVKRGERWLAISHHISPSPKP